MKGTRKTVKTVVGSNSLARNGERLVAIAAYGDDTIDVIFPDGTIAWGVTIEDFLNSKVDKPPVMPGRHNNVRMGERRRHKNGQTMTLVTYRLATDVDVLFDDGTIVYHTNYYAFRRGSVRKTKERRIRVVA